MRRQKLGNDRLARRLAEILPQRSPNGLTAETRRGDTAV